MRAVVRSIDVVLLGIAAAVLMGFSSTLVSVIALAATTALIMGGTFHPLSFPPDSQDFVDSYTADANERYLECEPGCTVVGVVTPEAFFPVFGTLTFNQSVEEGRQNLDNCIAGLACTFTRTFPLSGTTTAPLPADTYRVFGHSQSATITTLEKRLLAETHDEGEGPDVSFEVTGNPNRPNGGFLARGPEGLTIPFLDVTFSGPTPTDTQYETDDTARQYDGWSDGAVNPLNILADINALVGIALLHSDYFGPTVGEPILQDKYGDTTYYLIPTKTLPLLMWLEQIPAVGPFVAAVLDAPLRVLVEAGYDRMTSPGQPTGWNIFYTPNPIALAVNFLVAIPTGWDDAISQAAGDPNLRPFQTEPAGPYGVGGPPVTLDPTTNEQNQQLTTPANDDTDSFGMDLDSTADTGNDVQRQSVVAQQSVTPQQTADVTTETTAIEDDTKTDLPAADTPDADPPAAKSPDADTASTPSVTIPSPPKIRNPIGADRPKLSDPAPAIKRAFTKPDERDTTDGDDTSQNATKTGDSDKEAA
jgi:PE-PPE domain